MKTMKLLAMICGLLGITTANAQNSGAISRIDIQTMKKEVIGKKVQLVDVRTAKEYKAGHIGNAINIDISNKANFKAQVAKLDKSKPIYIYCYVGGRSRRASKVLQTEGFTEIYDFSGGWRAWSSQN